MLIKWCLDLGSPFMARQGVERRQCNDVMMLLLLCTVLRLDIVSTHSAELLHVTLVLPTTSGKICKW